jgi:DNA relaxase NicK
MTYNDVENVYAAVDWYTSTYAPGVLQTLPFNLASDISIVEADKGFKVRPWSFYGYQGQAVGGIAFGRRADGMIVRLSSELADEHWRDFHKHAHGVSRIDLAVTVRFKTDRPGMASDAYAKACTLAKSSANMPTYTLITSDRGGDTLYLGKRISDLLGRFYDKGRQSDDPNYARCWRYEMEAKGDVAKSVANQLAGERHYREAIAQTVHAYYRKRNVEPDYMPNVGPVLDLRTARPTDVERSLEYLHNAIRPMLDRLRAQGYGAAIDGILASSDEQE